MTDLTSPDTVQRIIDSLKENSARFERRRRAEATSRRVKRVAAVLLFVAGVACGMLVVPIVGLIKAPL